MGYLTGLILLAETAEVASWVSIIERVGISVVLLCGLGYILGWKLGPRVVDGHLKFLDKTTEAMESLVLSQKKVIGKLDDVASVSKDTDKFMGIVQKEHATQEDKIDAVHDDVKKIKSVVVAREDEE